MSAGSTSISKSLVHRLEVLALAAAEYRRGDRLVLEHPLHRKLVDQHPVALSDVLKLLDRVEDLVGEVFLSRARMAEARSLRRLLAALVLAGQNPPVERAVAHDRHVELAAERDASRSRSRGRGCCSGPAPRRSAAGCAARPSRASPPSATRSGWRPRVEDLPVPDESVERLEGLLDGRDRIGVVKLVEVDVVRLQALQRALAGLDDMPARAAAALPAAPTGAVEHLHPALGGDDRFSRLTEVSLSARPMTSSDLPRP
jgi:hypothetical protein